MPPREVVSNFFSCRVQDYPSVKARSICKGRVRKMVSPMVDVRGREIRRQRREQFSMPSIIQCRRSAQEKAVGQNIVNYCKYFRKIAFYLYSSDSPKARTISLYSFITFIAALSISSRALLSFGLANLCVSENLNYEYHS